MRRIRIVLIEPDTDAARSFSACAEVAFPSATFVHAPTAASLDPEDLRNASIVLCADAPPVSDALEAIPAIHEHRSSLPIVVLMDEFDAARGTEAVKFGAIDCLPRAMFGVAAFKFMIEKHLAMATLHRNQFLLHAGLTKSLAELIARNRELTDTASRLEVMASTDPLTRLNNRWWLKHRLDAMFAEAVRYGSDLACMMIDLDGFKFVNDLHGHQQGDRVLELTAQFIKDQIRSTDAAARYGGDEFIILLPRASLRRAVRLAARLQKKFQSRVIDAVHIDTACTMCIGVASLSISRPGAAHVLVRQADAALYAAKRSGANRAMICSEDGVTLLDAQRFAA